MSDSTKRYRSEEISPTQKDIHAVGSHHKETVFLLRGQYSNCWKIPNPNLAISMKEVSRLHSLKPVSCSHTLWGCRIEWDQRISESLSSSAEQSSCRKQIEKWSSMPTLVVLHRHVRKKWANALLTEWTIFWHCVRKNGFDDPYKKSELAS